MKVKQDPTEKRSPKPNARKVKIDRVRKGRVMKKAGDGTDKENSLRSGGAKNTRTRHPQQEAFTRKNFTDLLEVGRGGFSVVYQARMANSNSICVLKFLNHAELKKLNCSKEDIQAERSLSGLMEHENIVKLLGFFETKFCSVLVMEFCDRGDLWNYIQLPTSEVAPFPRCASRNQDYVLQLVKAVDYFQKTAKYIHMDIKPDNILVTSKDIIKLTDFGCAVPMKSPRHVHRLHNGGTEPYRPPEMFKKPKQFDSTHDVWGIGCVAFQLNATNGEHPFFYQECTADLGSDVKTGVERMTAFKFGFCPVVGNFNRMDEKLKTFLRQTIGAEREQRPLVSRLLETAYLTSTARTFNS